MTARGVLLVDPAPSSSLLSTSDGCPVWPARTASERGVITRVAELFGAQVSWQRGQRAKPGDRREKVVGLGPSSVRAGRLYAHLTGRRFEYARDAKEAFHDGAPAVIVLAGPPPDARLLRMASVGATSPSVTGLIYSQDAVRLRRQVLVRAAAASLCGDVDLPRVDVSPLSPIGRIESDGHVIVGGQASTDETVAALSSGAAVVNVFGHSDGVDALGGPVVVCARAGRPDDTRLRRRPRCHLTGECHRLEMPVDAALASPMIMRPEQVAARVLVWHTCLGVMPSNWTVDPRLGLGVRFLDSPSVGAMVTTWAIGPLRPSQTANLAELLTAGHTVGEALAACESHKLPGPTMRLCLLGDPRVRAVPSVPTPAEPEPYRVTPASVTVAARPGGYDALGFAGRLLVRSGDAVAAALRSYEQADASTESTAQLQAAIVGWLTTGSWTGWLASWTAAAKIIARDERACQICGAPTDTYVGDLGPGGVRRCTTCHGCNAIADVPIESTASLAVVRPRHVRLHGWRPSRPWAGALTVSSSAAWDRGGWAWPAAADGGPHSDLHVPRWPPGPLRVAAVLASTEGVTVLNRMVWSGASLSRG
jgi:hypothetical protein